ncbi:MAG: RsmE family RNA methyltransferase [Acidimicrobiales bacterium]
MADLDTPVLDDDDCHHLGRVLRLRPGQIVSVADGSGRWRSCVWRTDGSLEPSGEVVTEPAATPELTVAFALTKGAKPEWAVQKLTELGVDTIVPFLADRSVVRWDREVARRHVGRWRTVARQAAMQSRRTRLPAVAEVVPFAEMAAQAATTGALAEPGGAPPSLARPTVLVGPEGGWSPAELACGLPTVALGPTILRAETAAMTAAALLIALRAGLL